MENSAHNWNRQHVNSLLFIDEPSISPLGAAVQLLFSLPPVWAFPPLIWAFRFQHFSTGFLSFLFRYLFSSSQTECVFLPPVWAFPSSHLGLSHPLIWGLPFTSFLRSSLSFESLACWMLEQFVFEKVHFLGSLQQGTAAVEVRLPIFSSPSRQSAAASHLHVELL